jgi:peroxiredoxin
VVFVYPYTGRPGVPDPPDWDIIPGAHGSTPQAQAYSRLYGQFLSLNVNVYGVSFQDSEWQREFVARCAIRFSLLSDRDRLLARALSLPFFQTGGTTYLRRLTLLVNNGRIDFVHFPVPDPGADAAYMLDLISGPAA